jgi:hypothetical protein
LKGKLSSRTEYSGRRASYKPGDFTLPASSFHGPRIKPPLISKLAQAWNLSKLWEIPKATTMATLAGKPMTQNGLGLADVYLILLLSFNSKDVDKYRIHKSGGANTK